MRVNLELRKRAWQIGAGLLAAAALFGSMASGARAEMPNIQWMKAPALWSQGFTPEGVVFSPSGHVFAFRTSSFTEVRKTSDQKLLFTIPVSHSANRRPLFLTSTVRQGMGVFVTGESVSGATQYQFWRATDSTLLETVRRTRGLEYSPDFLYAVETTFTPDTTTTNPFTVIVRRFRDDHILFTVENVLAWKFSPRSSHLYVLRSDRTLQALNLADGSVVREIPSLDLGANVTHLGIVAIARNEAFFLLGRPSGLELRSLTDGRLLRTFPNATYPQFHHDGYLLSYREAEETPQGTIYRTRFWQFVVNDWVPILPELSNVAFFEFSPDGRSIMTWEGRTEEGSAPVFLRRTFTGEVIREFPAAIPQGFSPDGQLAVLALILNTTDRGVSDYLTTFWRTDTGQRVDQLEDYRAIWDIAFSPDGQMLAGTTAKGEVRVWRANDGTLLRVWEAPETTAGRVSFSPGGQTVIVEGPGGTREWRISDGQLVRQVEGPPGIVSPDGQVFAVRPPNGTAVELRRVADRSLIRTLAIEGGTVHPLAFTPDGATLLTRTIERKDASGNTFNTFETWSVSGGNLLRTLATVDDPHPSFETDGRLLTVLTYRSPDPMAGIPESRTLSVYRVSDGALLHSETLSSANFAARRQFGRVDLESETYTVRNFDNGTLLLRDLITGRLLQTFNLGERDPFVGIHTMFTPDEQYLITVEPRRISFWDVETGQRVHHFDRELNAVGSSLTFSPDGLSMAYTQGARVLVVADNPVGILLGDVNDNRKVEVGDAILTLRFVTRVATPTARERLAADIVTDGILTVQDAILILRRAVGLPV
ncbi:MAG: hypothetical protein KY468_04845 [Armatimonadetes bacterium]|nr:hypothetical protein [Armatimonadota bacterium]